MHGVLWTAMEHWKVGFVPFTSIMLGGVIGLGLG